jgi:tellurite resistance protein TehA-like permease
VLAVVLVLWIGKLVRHFDVVRREWVHPVQGPLLALLPVSALLAVTLLAPYEGDARTAATAVVLVALAMQLAIAWEVVALLFAGPLPAAIRPTLGIEMAPAAVSTLAAATLWPQLPADALMICLGVACGPVIAVLTRWRWWTDVPFSVGFWSFSFPVAALAAATIEAVRRGGWATWVAWTAIGIASAVIGFLAVRTVLLLLRGRLLPS